MWCLRNGHLFNITKCHIKALLEGNKGGLGEIKKCNFERLSKFLLHLEEDRRTRQALTIIPRPRIAGRVVRRGRTPPPLYHHETLNDPRSNTFSRSCPSVVGHGRIGKASAPVGCVSCRGNMWVGEKSEAYMCVYIYIYIYI